MKREEIKDIRDILKTSMRHNYTCSLSQKDTVRLIKYINQLEADKMEAYKAIVELLDNEMSGMDKRALRDEAEKYIKDNE